MLQNQPQEGLNGEALSIQEKVLGGCSSINELPTCVDREDYDTWKELGNNGWGCENVKQYFQNH